MTYGKGCIERQHLRARAMAWHVGFGQRASYHLAGPTFAEAGPKVWSLNRLGVPPVLTNPTEVCGAKSAWGGGEIVHWNWKVVRLSQAGFDLGLIGAVAVILNQGLRPVPRGGPRESSSCPAAGGERRCNPGVCGEVEAMDRCDTKLLDMGANVKGPREEVTAITPGPGYKLELAGIPRPRF